MHVRLVDAYRKDCPNGWPTGPNDGYFFEYLAYHLNNAGKNEELNNLLLDFDWLETKLAAKGVETIYLLAPAKNVKRLEEIYERFSNDYDWGSQNRFSAPVRYDDGTERQIAQVLLVLRKKGLPMVQAAG